jgi:hypothetical protein
LLFGVDNFRQTLDFKGFYWDLWRVFGCSNDEISKQKNTPPKGRISTTTGGPQRRQASSAKHSLGAHLSIF